MGVTKISRAQAVIDGDGKRHCAWDGDYIDPIDWCSLCASGTSCGRPHKRLRLRADAAFCGPGCRAAHRASFIRDCT
jgi:hypothetical protein